MSDPHLPRPRAGTIPMTEERERRQRLDVIAAARSWIGTPYRQRGYTKGRKGCVDCSMLLVAAFVEGGVFEPFDPRPYPPEWHMHQSEERYLAWMDKIGLRTETPRPGDVVLWRVGHCYAHSGIIVAENQVVHAFQSQRFVSMTPLDLPVLTHEAVDRRRPRIYFDMWGRLRMMEPD